MDFFLKLWNRGVDISVNVISALIVTGIVALFWKWKKERELELERERLKLRREVEELQEQRQRQKTLLRLAKERQQFVDRFRATRFGSELHASWKEFSQWLTSSGLSSVAENWQILERWRQYADFAGVTTDDNAVRFAYMVAADISSNVKNFDETDSSAKE